MIESEDFSPGNSGFQIRSDGNVEFYNGVFRGRIEADEGYFHGHVEAESGTFHGRIEAEDSFFSGGLSAGGTWDKNYNKISDYAGIFVPKIGQDNLVSIKDVKLYDTVGFLPLSSTRSSVEFHSSIIRKQGTIIIHNGSQKISGSMTLSAASTAIDNIINGVVQTVSVSGSIYVPSSGQGDNSPGLVIVTSCRWSSNGYYYLEGQTTSGNIVTVNLTGSHACTCNLLF